MNLTLSRNESNVLKGLAILSIVLHNFCHWLPRCVAENEYMFHVSNTEYMARVLLSGGPHVVLNFFSYFGHYGVPLFLFISGYGLVKKYEREERKDVPVAPFLAYNILKLWKLMIPGVLLLVAAECYRCGRFTHEASAVAWFLTFVTNFLPSGRDLLLPHRDLLLGPWWYFSLTLQMYLLWRFCYYRRSRKWIVGSAVVCLLLQTAAVTVFLNEDQTMLDYIRYNLSGCLLPFAFGVWTARYGFRITPASWTAALLLFVAGCYNVYLWMLTPLTIVVVVWPLTRIRRKAFVLPLQWMGGISAALFVLHPIVRGFYQSPFREIPVYSSLVGYLFFSFLGAWLLSKVIGRIPLFKF